MKHIILSTLKLKNSLIKNFLESEIYFFVSDILAIKI